MGFRIPEAGLHAEKLLPERIRIRMNIGIIRNQTLRVGKKLLSLCLALVAVFTFAAPACAAGAEVAVGDRIFYGSYPQTEEGTDHTPIEWQVLDVQDGKALCLSYYGLDAQPFNTVWAEVCWDGCTLRTWLNDDFLNAAFTPEEQAAVELTHVENDRPQNYGGYSRFHAEDTDDRIFLLSYAEANKYLKVIYWGIDDETNVWSRVTPTPYAISRGAWRDLNFFTRDGDRAGWWWLRSPGLIHGNAARVIWRGSLCNRKVQTTDGCVRPAFWLNLSRLPDGCTLQGSAE